MEWVRGMGKGEWVKGEGNGVRPVVTARARTRRPAGRRVRAWMVFVFGLDQPFSRN